ncbi:MAG: tetratricopeptide repeat protein [Burkholderiales bacterium]|nr:tetratricopeptide repeat protein [Burkholderiales bacterium]
MSHFNAHRYVDAITCLEGCLVQRHDWPQAHYYLGLATLRLGRHEEAADALVMALCFAPEMGSAHYALAVVEHKQGHRAEALESVRRAIERGERNADSFNLQGALLLEQGDLRGAVESFEQACGIDPNHALAHSNLGYLLMRECAEYDRGARHIEHAVELAPQNALVQCNYSLVLAHRGELEEAIRLCDRLLAAQPQLHEARLNRALALLKLGRFETAWDDYEARKQVRCNFVPRAFPYPEWRGEEIAARTLLIHGEQGLGDEIMFASCFGDVFGRARHCIIECAPSLERLFRRSFPQASVVAGSQSEPTPGWLVHAPAIDLQVPAGSLPRYLRREHAAFPAHAGYLVADAERVANWRCRLKQLGPGIKIGISWRGGMVSTRRNLRSIDLPVWEPLLRQEGAHFVNLQYGHSVAELDALRRERGIDVAYWPEAIDDFDETAALVAALDGIVSVCTAVIHLSGALGRKAWVLVPESPEWRYMAQGDTMPWYPSIRLLRQHSAGDWTGVMVQAANCLRELADAS